MVAKSLAFVLKKNLDEGDLFEEEVEGCQGTTDLIRARNHKHFSAQTE